MTDRFLTFIGDTNDASARGGSPRNLVQAGMRAGFFVGGWQLSPERARRRRVLWNLLELLRTGERGGYQFTLDFARQMIAQVPKNQRYGEVVSTFPVFPPADWIPGQVNFYIDATFNQLFGEYGISHLVSRRVQQDVLARERAQYAAAEHICCMSRWAACAVVESYGVPPEKVHIVGGGANVEESATLAFGQRSGPHSPFRLGFVGKDWQRKGLMFLLEVAELLQSMGVAAEVWAAGFDPASGPSHRLLRAVGFIDKRIELERFVKFIYSCDLGCLFSSSEAYGLSNIEFLRLGVPVITRDAGGMADTVPDGCGYVFAADEGPEVVAGWIGAIVAEPEQYRRLAANVAENPQRFGWDGVVERMQAVWHGSKNYSYGKLVDNA